MCFLSKTPNEAWHLLENLGWDLYEFERGIETRAYPTSDLYVFHVNSCLHGKFRNTINLLCS